MDISTTISLKTEFVPPPLSSDLAAKIWLKLAGRDDAVTGDELLLYNHLTKRLAYESAICGIFVGGEELT